MSATSYRNVGNTLEKFRDTIPGNSKTPTDIVPLMDPSGDLKKITGIDVIVTGIRNLLLTSKGSYVFDPEYGVGIHRYIFDLFDERTEELIKSEITGALRRYEGRASVKPVIRKLSGGRKGFKIDLEIKYRGENRSISLSFDESLLRDG